jgi:hypothetical protein
MVRVHRCVLTLLVLGVSLRAASAQECAWTLRQITSGSLETGNVSMSADGQRVVFLRFTSGDAEVRLFDATSGTTTTLGSGWNPVINMAGTKVGLVTMANDPAIVDTQTGVMTTWPVGPVYEAALSADGSRIAFISTRGDLDPSHSNPYQYPQVFVMDVATGGITQLSDITAYWVTNVGLSGDGTRVVWVQDFASMKTVDLSDGQIRDLGVGFSPVITEDGSSVAYINDWGTELRAIDLASHVERVVARSDRGFGFPRFSSDGQRIVVLSSGDVTGSNPDLDVELFVVDLASGNVTQVTSGSGNFSMPIPGINGDGTRVAFADGRALTGPNPEGNFEVFVATCGQNSVVPYEFGGFESPLLADGSASFRKGANGRVVPVAFQLRRNGEIVATATASMVVHKVLDEATGTIDMTDLTTDAGQSNEDSGWFRYDAQTERYVFNLSTRNMSASATYRIQVTLNDGTVHTAIFSLR